jgi:S-adenosylmethionine:tRNA-ribosyltransferase-isomerase (queuine synthetase)
MDDKWKEKIERKIEELEKDMNRSCLVQKDEKYELREMIISAVKEATNPIMEKLEEHEKRIVELENQDGKKALLILKSVGATTLGWIVLGLLNNILAIFHK